MEDDVIGKDWTGQGEVKNGMHCQQKVYISRCVIERGDKNNEFTDIRTSAIARYLKRLSPLQTPPRLHSTFYITSTIRYISIYSTLLHFARLTVVLSI